MKIEVIVETQPLPSSAASRRTRARNSARPSTPSNAAIFFPDPLEDELEGFYKLRVENLPV